MNPPRWIRIRSTGKPGQHYVTVNRWHPGLWWYIVRAKLLKRGGL